MGTGPSGRQSGLHNDCVAQDGGARLRTFLWREHRGDTVAVVLLLLLPALFFWSGLVDPASIIREDAASYFQPFYALANREIAAGRIPLWNPYLLLGVPFHASCFPSIFYPLRWPLFAVDFVSGHLLLIWSHYFLTGLAAYLLMRVAVKVRAPAALIGAVGITYGGFALGHMPHLPWVMSYPWFITTITFTWLNQVRPRWYWCAGGGVSIGLIALTGAIHLLLVLAVWLGTFVAYHTAVEVVQFVRRRSPGYTALARPATLVVATCVLGGLIGAIQLLPAGAMIKGSAREAPSWAFINTACAHPVRNSIQLAVPFFFGNHRTGYWGEHLYHGMAHYSGGVVLLASILGVTCLGRDRHLWFLVVIAVVGFFVGAGQYLPVYRWLYDWLPGFGQLRNPTRIFWCTDIALACLGAIGIDSLWNSWQATPERRRIRVGVSVAASALLMLVVVWALAQLYSHRDDPTPLVRAIHHVPDDVLRIPARLVNGARQVAQYAFEKHDPLIWGNVAATLAAAVLFPLLVWRRRRPGVFVVMGLVLIETADLFALSLGQAMHDSKHQVVEGVPPRAQWLQENLGEQRYLVLPNDENPVPPYQVGRNRAAQFGLRGVQGVMAGLLENPGRSEYLCRIEQSPVLLTMSGTRIVLSERRLQRRKLREVHKDDRFRYYENLDCLPLVYLVKKLMPATSQERAFARMHNQQFTPHETAIVYGKPPEQTARSAAQSYEVRRVDTVPGRWEIDAVTDAPMQLVILEGFDAGWRCDVNGNAVDILQTNDRFMSVPVPAGNSTAVLKYAPPSFTRGAILSVVGLLLAGGMLATGYLQARRPRSLR